MGGTCTLLTDLQNKSVQALTKPGYLQSVTDPAFGTKITRITGDPTASIPIVGGTWGNVARHRYSKEAAWNADQSLIVLKRVENDPTSHLFLNGSTYQVEFAASPPPNARESETRWHPTSPDIMIYVTKTTPLIVGHWNVRGGYTAKVTLSGYTDGYFGPFEGNSSRDGRYIVVFATRSSDQKVVAFAVDLSTGQKFPDIDLVASGLEVTVDAGWASISASGNYVVLVGKKVATGSIHVSKVYNRVDGAFVKELPSNFVHYDLTLDAAGDDVGVGMKTGSGNYNFSSIRLRDAFVRDLDPSLVMGTSSTHSSARNLGRPGWAYMTVNNGPDPFQSEIFALRLDGSGAVERLAHHRSNVTVYDTEPHAVPSPDGKRVLFASNWGATPVHAFVVDVRPICP